VSDIGPVSRAIVLVCVTCRTAVNPTGSPGIATPSATALAAVPRVGVDLAEATIVAAANAPDISVQRVRCLGNCSRGLSAAIRYANAWTYVFGGLDPTRDGPSLIVAARLLAQASDGIMPWRGRPDSLKRGLIARIPPIDFCEESP
jgi:predicted metal-binding protein